MKIFFSHSSRDKAVVREIKNQMFDFLNIWLDENELLPGELLENRISSSINKSDLFVLFISESSIRSNWVKKEVQQAQEKEQSLGRPYLIPVLLDEINTNDLLATDKVYLKLNSQFRDDVHYFAKQLNERIFHLTIRYGISSDVDNSNVLNTDENLTPSSVAVALGGKMREMVHEQRDVYIEIINTNLEIRPSVILSLLYHEASERLREATERENEWGKARDDESAVDTLRFLGILGSTMFDIQAKVAKKIISRLDFFSLQHEKIKDEEALYLVKKFITQL